jgi:adenosine deaminase
MSIGEHPIRPIADAGVPVTINSDDILVFDQSVSEEYLLLYNEGVFNAEELDTIRKESLQANLK